MGNDLFKPKDDYKLIDGMHTSVEPIGYCHYSGHRGYLTKKTMRMKGCNKKNCRYFQKNMEHDWWIRKEQIKSMKAAVKEGKSTYTFNEHTYQVSEKI